MTLSPLPNPLKRPGPVLVVVLDGIGLGKQDDSNAVFLAKTPNFDAYFQGPLYTQLKAHGTAVGMPSDADMGNSEVGHNALGAGRVFDQGASLVKNAIETETLFQGNIWKKLIHNVRDHRSTFHLIGLLSEGNVHSHLTHLFALIDSAVREGVQCCRLHLLTDGRDMQDRTASQLLQRVEAKLNSIDGDYKIASGGGRMLMTMDRYDADWDMVERGWKAHVLGDAEQCHSAVDFVNDQYRKDATLSDQYMPGFVVAKNGVPIGTILDKDSVVFFNFRGDRAIELTKAFEWDHSFTYFDRQRVPNVEFAGMTLYDGDLKLPKQFLVNAPEINHPMGEYICRLGLPSFALSETQKYGHVTYFWNGNRSGYLNNDLETYVEIPSDNVPFNQKPAMKAKEITDAAIELIDSGNYRFGRINYPNGDMVGHTGDMNAVIETCEVTDRELKRLVDANSKAGGVTIILADHGNADEMYTIKNGEKIPKTSHTLNPVPCRIVDPLYDNEYKLRQIETPGLANVAATVFNLLGYERPQDYDESLILF